MLEKLVEIIRKEELDYNSFFLLYEIVVEGRLIACSPENILELQNKKLVKIISYEELIIEPRQKGIDLINDTIEKLNSLGDNPKKKKKDITSEIEEWIEDYRLLFKGTKSGAMGDKKSCLEKMVRFFETYPEFADKDLIFKATQNYINSEAVNQRYRFLQRADYFVFKKLEKEETSRLASFCDEVKIGNEVNSTNILDLN